jgi:hypothetical protein
VSSTFLSTVHLAATAAMVGLIWFVQVVHYPLFGAVGADGFVAYETAHRWRTGLVVGPLMAVESVTALVLVADPPSGVGRGWPVAGVALLAVIHASTVLLQVRRHEELNAGYDERAHRRLVRSNWIRTVGWSARCVVAAAIVLAA